MTEGRGLRLRNWRKQVRERHRDLLGFWRYGFSKMIEYLRIRETKEVNEGLPLLHRLWLLFKLCTQSSMMTQVPKLVWELPIGGPSILGVDINDQS
jgi:hypothetical protein